jgi:hypothetical protein
MITGYASAISLPPAEAPRYASYASQASDTPLRRRAAASHAAAFSPRHFISRHAIVSAIAMRLRMIATYELFSVTDAFDAPLSRRYFQLSPRYFTPAYAAFPHRRAATTFRFQLSLSPTIDTHIGR